MRFDKEPKFGIIYFLTLICVLVVSPMLWAQAPAGKSPAVSQGSVRLPTPEIGAKIETKKTGDEKSSDETGEPATNGEAKKKELLKEEKGPDGEERVYLNVQEQDIKDVIKQISKATGKNFIIDSKISGKITIISEKTMTKEEAYQAFLSALEVAGFTTVQGPGGIYKVVPSADAKKSPIPLHMDSTPYTDSFVTRLIQLKNISALEMSNAIKDLISKNGNQFAYPATNTLIITDSGTNIDRLMKLIKELDQEGPQQVLEIIPIKHADAKDIAQKVTQLYEVGQKAAGAPGPAKKGVHDMEEIKEVSQIIADDRTNSLIVLASKRAIDKVRDIISKLDVPLMAGDTGTIHVHYLKFAKATDLAQTLASITSGKAAPPAAKPGEKAAGKSSQPPPIAQLEGGITIGADETTNALIITASAKDYQTLVDELISKLDVPRRQVYLEAIVMELEVQKGKQAGVSGFGGGGNKSLIGFGNVGSSQFNALTGLFNPSTFFATPGLLGGLLSKDSVTVSVPKAGGGTTDLTIPAFSAFLNLLQTYRDANIVSTPNIMTLDNQKASIEVTRTIYANKTTTAPTAGTTIQEPSPLEAGLTLEITPQITEGDAVRLEIHHKLSNFTGQPGPTGAAPQTKREITTTVMAMNDQTVVLGGLMEDNIVHEKSKVPILGDIPLLGLLFRSSSTTNTKSNLLVFITPHVLRDPSDFAEMSKLKIEQRNSFIEQNFGKRQQQAIRDTIALHRADLLEFTSPAPPPVQQAPEPSEPVPGPRKKTSKALPPADSPKDAAKKPVITAEPVGAYDSGSPAYSSAGKPPAKSGASRGREQGEIDNAY